MRNTTVRVLLVRGGTHWQVQTRGHTYNLGTVRSLGLKPPYELADRKIMSECRVRVADWVPGMPGANVIMGGVWHATY